MSQPAPPRVIAIDGPAGAGKSSVSAALAARLGFTRLDTGALYRAIGLAALRAGVRAEEGEALRALLADLRVELDGAEVLLDGVAEGDALRRPEVSAAASDFARLPSVRAKLLDLQRAIGAAQACVVDGRDIGTVVFPDAPLKIYLTASARARAERRLLELAAKGMAQPLDEVQREIEARDAQDASRPIAPLRRAEDAVLVDATALGLEEVVARCCGLARGVFGG
ncbi:MAG: (d)CMP kinase [Deltaproteobacteria bacterium]|nr:(d)CMP kinase [Deltaproteobacteria bacterium]